MAEGIYRYIDWLGAIDVKWRSYRVNGGPWVATGKAVVLEAGDVLELSLSPPDVAREPHYVYEPVYVDGVYHYPDLANMSIN